MIRVFAERDKVILDPGGRCRDLLLTCGQAEDFEQALREKADVAERAPRELIRGEPWGIRVESYDGFVAVRFYPPLGTTATRVPLPVAVARQLADLVKFKAQQAAYKMRFETARN